MSTTLAPAHPVPGPPPAPGADSPAGRRGLGRRLVQGRPEDPAWVRPALLALLGLTALAYLWDLGASGWANSFYSAAVQAGTKSWKAFFFGSFDSANFITVDKPPASLWVMGLSARVFGVNPWSILVPQALEGVATVGLLYATVRRWFLPAAALIAGAVLALTPVAALMFRFNNPDALLVLLLTGAAYATVRAVEDGRTRWMVLAGSLVGLGFMTKMLQALVVVPVLAAVYLLAGPSPGRRRIALVAAGGAALVVSGGWWVATVELIPASARPYIGGSQDNSLLNLILGYNGFGRLTGNETGSVGGGGAVGSRWGPTGWNRLFLSDMGGQISWLIPAAVILAVAGLWLTRRAARTDRTRAAIVLWGGWLVVTGAVFSFSAGIIHPYYTVALAPAVGALVGVGSVSLWRHRDRWPARAALGTALAVSAMWAYLLLDRTPAWLPALRVVVVAAGLALAVAVVVLRQPGRALSALLVTGALVVGLAGPAAYSLATISTPHAGAIPSAGPSGQGAGPGGPGGGTPGGGSAGGFGGSATGGGGFAGPTARPPGPAGHLPGAAGGFPGGPGTANAGGFAGGASHGLRAGAAGGLLNASTPSAAVVGVLSTDAGRFTWVAATVGSNSAAGYQLSTGDPVMALGGFNGTDPAPTLAQFEKLVAAHRIHYFISGGTGGGPAAGGTSSTSTQITSWVTSHYRARTVGGVTLYDLSATPAAA
ncbi:MAG: glycosyltransferase family 39 protein [Acidimicrobiales bacterium]